MRTSEVPFTVTVISAGDVVPASRMIDGEVDSAYLSSAVAPAQVVCGPAVGYSSLAI